MSISDSPNHVFKNAQTCLEKIQSLHKCVGVSGSALHNLQVGSFGQFLLIKLFAVSIFLCSKVHAKKRHLGSALALQISLKRILLYVPSN
jgi:hypothetical protein